MNNCVCTSFFGSIGYAQFAPLIFNVAHKYIYIYTHTYDISLCNIVFRFTWSYRKQVQYWAFTCRDEWHTWVCNHAHMCRQVGTNVYLIPYLGTHIHIPEPNVAMDIAIIYIYIYGFIMCAGKTYIIYTLACFYIYIYIPDWVSLRYACAPCCDIIWCM